MQKTVIIVGEGIDPHVQSVTAELCALGAAVKLLDPISPSNGTFISFAVDESVADHRIREETTSIWWRFKPPIKTDTKTESAEFKFQLREWQHALESLDFLLPNSSWVNGNSWVYHGKMID